MESSAPEQSLRPQQRPERRPEPEPEPRRAERAPEPQPQRQAAPQPQGNADRSARAGQATGRAEGTSATSGQGGQASTAGNAAASNYPGLVMRKISRVPRPRVGSRGEAVVAFRIAANGGLAGASLARSSGSAALDNAALQVIRRAAPFPPPPRGARSDYTITIKGQ